MARSVGRMEMEIRRLAWITAFAIGVEAKVSHEIRKFCCMYARRPIDIHRRRWRNIE
jgi:hypothetical protein